MLSSTQGLGARGLGDDIVKALSSSRPTLLSVVGNIKDFSQVSFKVYSKKSIKHLELHV